MPVSPNPTRKRPRFLRHDTALRLAIAAVVATVVYASASPASAAEVLPIDPAPPADPSDASLYFEVNADDPEFQFRPAVATGVIATAIGVEARAFGDYSVALGAGSIAQGLASVALGTASHADGWHGTALGNNAYVPADNSVALGAESFADRDDTVSIGSDKRRRQLTQVADGTQDFDAVNLRQRKAAGVIDANGDALDVVTYDAHSQRERITFAGARGTVLDNVSDGRIADDSREAVNGGQLYRMGASLQAQVDALDGRVDALESGVVSVEEPVGDNANQPNTGGEQNPPVAPGVGLDELNDRLQAQSTRNDESIQAATQRLDDRLDAATQRLDRRIDDSWRQLNERIDDNARQANRGIAGAAALVQVTPYVPGRTAINAGIASYRGETALGVGVSRWNESGRVNFNAGISAAANDEPIFRVGVGFVLD